MPELTWPQALRFRVGRLGIDPPAGRGVVRLVDRLCGVQAQVMSTAEEAVVVRGASANAFATALHAGKLARTWTVRGTLHVVPVAAAADQLALLAGAGIWRKGAWQKAFASLETMDALAELVERALRAADGPLTREELVAAIEDDLGRPELGEELRSGWSALLKPLAWQGILCQGPPRGRNVTFGQPADLLEEWPGLPDPDSAGPRVLRAYVHAFGPVTLDAFDAWLIRGGTPRQQLRGWRAALGDELAEVDVEGRAALVLAADVDELAATQPEPDAEYLLPAFDQYVLGPGTNDTAVIAAEHRARVSRAGGWISPVVVRGGRVVGTWEPGEDGPVIARF